MTGTQARADEPAAGNSIVFPGNDGQAHDVSWDGHSFTIDGERLVIWSGELHHWRVPHEDGWRDVMQKLRAAGFNAVSLYFFWGLHQSEEGGEFDFSDPHDLDKLFTMAAEEGLYVIARPGPYINAEVSMGGLPTWMVNKMAGSLRSTDPSVLDPSKAWLSAFNQIAKKHQVTDGGGSLLMYQVENELISDNAARRDFLKALAESVKADGITVPLFHNDYGMGGRFKDSANLGLDFYAYDNYPIGFSCDAGRRELGDQESGFRTITTTSPMFITEAQGGAFSPWGAPWTDNDECKKFADTNFTRQWGVNNIGNGVTAFNYYMIIGGTNWGFTGAPGSGFTSYDYGAALNEDRTITAKLAVQKELGYYQRGVPVGSMGRIDAPVAAEVTGSTPKLYQRQATDGLDQSVTGNGTRYIGAMLSNSNTTTETAFTIPLTLDEGSSSGTDQFSDDDRSAAITYSSGWSQVADGTAYKGTLTTSSTAGSTATVAFSGTGLEVISPRGTAYGKATISIDGGTPVEFDEWIDSDQNAPLQATVYRIDDLPAGEHTAVIRVSGQAATGGTGTKIAIDAVNALGADTEADSYVVNDSDTSFFTYSPAPVQLTPSAGTESANWTHASGFAWTSGDLSGDETFARTAGNSVEFTFDGTGFQVIGAWSSNHGPADVYLDGELVGQTTEQVSQTAQLQKVIFEKTGLTAGTHTVRLVHTGTFFPGAQDARGSYFALDAVKVFTKESTTAPQPTGEVSWARIPQQTDTKVRVHGRDATMLTADLKIGGLFDMYYTTSQVFDQPLTTARGTEQALVGYPGDPGETVLRVEPGYTFTAPAGVTQVYDAATKQLRINYTHTATAQDVVVTTGGKTLVLKVLDRDAAANTWHISGVRGTGNSTVWVSGADLVRRVTFEGTTAHITGSMSTTGTLKVTLPAGITSYTWNGSALVSNAAPAPTTITAPTLTWVKATEAAESAVDFDDSGWTLANATNKLNPYQGPGTNGVILDSNRYGFFNGSVWYRASYTAASDNPTLTFRGNGSTFSAQRKNPAFFQVWVNGVYAGARTLNGSTQSIPAPAGAVKAGQPVVVSVLANNLGLNLDWSDDGLSRQNRGLYEANLAAQGTVTWKIQGANNPKSTDDEVRGEYNVGGLYGERAGWYLPGYPTSDWDAASTMVADAPGVTWYRSSAQLNVPQGQDTAWRLELDVDNFGSNVSTRTNGSQAYLYVNGWNIGMFIGDVGPQKSFTIPSGWLNPRGSNDIAVAVIAKSAGQGPKNVRLVPIHSTTGSVGEFTPYAAPAAATHTATVAVDKTTATPDDTVTATGTSTAGSELGDGALTELTYEWTDPGASTAVAGPAKRMLEVAGTYTVRSVLRDSVSGQQLAVSAPATVKVEGDDTDVRPPAITAIDDTFVELGDPVSLQVEATDRSTPLTYSATGLPAGVTISASTGLISGTPTAKGTHEVTVRVADSLGNAAESTFTLRVGVAPKISVASAPARMDLASDGTVTYTLSDLPAMSKLSITAPARWQVSPTEQWVDDGTASITVRAPQAGTSGEILATVTSPEGVSASARAFITLDDPANPRVAGVAAWDSAEAGGEGATNGYVSAAVDGDTSTYWHTQWSGSSPTQPHYIVIDLGSEQKLTSFTYVPRPKSSCGSSIVTTACNGQIANYEISAATGGTWVAPTATQLRGATYAEPADATYATVASGTWAVANTDAKTVTFATPVTTRYLKLRSTSAVGSQTWSQAAELRVGGVAAPDPGTLPDVAMTPTLTATPEKVSPGGSVTVVAGGFEAGADVVVTLGSATRTVTADAAGYVSTELVVPAATRPGSLEVKATSGDLVAGATVTVEVAPTPTPTPSVTPTPTTSPTAKPTTKPSKTPTTKPTTPKPNWAPSVPYTLPGHHVFNGRQWNTTCEKYSQTTRCRTDIWATTVVKTTTGYQVTQGWAFNNLTYLPLMTRAQWKGNPLGNTGTWTAADGRNWRTECDTATTGRGACRSYTLTTVNQATPKTGGGYTFRQTRQWVFNNLVLFKQ